MGVIFSPELRHSLLYYSPHFKAAVASPTPIHTLPPLLLTAPNHPPARSSDSRSSLSRAQNSRVSHTSSPTLEGN